MDGSSEGTVVSLYNANVDYIFVFTLDYSQQMLYWMNSSDSCYYIESSSVDGSGRRIVYNTSRPGSCSNSSYRYSQAIDFFRGAVYSYSRHRGDIVKTVVEHTYKIIRYSHVSRYICPSLYTYSGMKVISPQRQLQGIT